MNARELFHKADERRNRLFSGLFGLLGLVAACAPGEAAPPATEAALVAVEPASVSTPLPPAGYAWVIFGADTVLAEVAATADERADGLMYREEVPDGTGMLFVFEDSQVRSFWMANTYVDLDIAYMDPAYRIVDIKQMEALNTESVSSRAPAMFALEVRQGWFAEQEIRVGAQADIVFNVPGR